MLVQDVRVCNSQPAFGVKFSKMKVAQGDNSIFSLHGELSQQLNSIVSAFGDVYVSLRKLELQKGNEDAKLTLEKIKDKCGIKQIHATPAEGITFADKGKDLIVSIHGRESVRFRDVNSKTGEISNSLFINGKRYVKTDTKHEIPETLQYWRKNEFNAEAFQKRLQERFDAVDFTILRVRREMLNPDVSAYLKQVDGAEIQTQINKLLLVNRNSEQNIPQPKKKLLSAYEKLLMQQKAEKENAKAKAKEVHVLDVVEPAKRRGRPPKVKEEINVVSQSMTEAPAKRRGRPPKVKEEINVVSQSMTEAPAKRRGRPPKVKDANNIDVMKFLEDGLKRIQDDTIKAVNELKAQVMKLVIKQDKIKGGK